MTDSDQRPERESSPTVWLGVMIVAFILGLVAWSELAKEIASANWTSTSGQVQWIRSGRYGPRVDYEYEVNGLKYSGRDTIMGFYSGGPCTVYYDAANPQRSLLDRGPRVRTALLSISPALVIGLALFKLAKGRTE